MSLKTILRRCVACRKMLDRQHLIKVTKDYQDGIVLEGGMGRSAYLCPSKTCLEDALKRKRLQKSLRSQIPSSVINSLQKQLNHFHDSNTEAKS